MGYLPLEQEQQVEDLLAVEFPDSKVLDPSQYVDVYRDLLLSPETSVRRAVDGIVTLEAIELILVSLVGLPTAEIEDFAVARRIADEARKHRDRTSEMLW